MGKNLTGSASSGAKRQVKPFTETRLFEANARKVTSLKMLKHIRSNLIAVIAYELCNPLSTIQVCLESLANEPKMPAKSRKIILDTAMKDVRFLHRLIEDCVDFSNTEFEGEVSSIEARSLQTPPQQILQAVLSRISQLTPVSRSYQRDRNCKKNNILSDTQQEILEHIRKNLIAIVGHELRTPLCTIEICLESLGNKSQMQHKYRQEMLDIALKDVSRLQKLIKDFFTLDRLEKGQIYQRTEYVRIVEAIDLALTSLRSRQRKENLPQIVVDIPPQLPEIRVDEDSLVEALTKLLDNACKFTKSNGEIKIQARIVESRIAHFMLEVTISDNGRGIIPSNLEAIFNCFYQEEDFLRRTVSGTGIGLAICRRIINNFGGNIWANSAGKNCGSSIHFTLPIAMG